MKKAAFYTLGCKVNQYETEAMTELFKKKNYEIVDFSESADVYVINTCSVTNIGDRKSRQMIRRAKKTNPNAVIAVTGCYAQTAPDEVLSIEGVNLVIGTKERASIVERVEDLTTGSSVNGVGDIMTNHEFEELRINSYEGRTRAYIKIQEGCNQFCSYCIIPYARGPVRSRREESVLDEVRELVKNGFSEIILVGIHVASYGADLGDTSLADLILKVDKIEGVKRIRLSSIEPMTLNHDFIEKISKSKKLCRHFHISLQSGCDATLKRMNRKYTTAEFAGIVKGLREAFEGAAITTDIMVGFPGETDEEFSETLKFIDEIKFADAHVFQYSRRRGTPAAKRPDQIAPEIKEKRSREVIERTKKHRDEFLSGFIGKTMPVLFERRVKSGEYEGKTDNYITVRVKSSGELDGQICDVIMENYENGVMKGTLQL